MLKSILTLGLIGLMAAPALADRGGRYARGSYHGGDGARTSFGLSLNFSNYGSSVGLGLSRGYARGYGGYYGGYAGYRYAAPAYCPPPVVYAPRYAPRPVYVSPPVVYAPAPVYVPPPVYVAPPVYAAPAPVYVAPAPTYYYNGYGTGGTYYYGR